MKTAVDKKLVAMVLVALSMLLLLFGWLATTGETKYDLSNYAGNIDSAISELEWLGLDTADARAVAGCLVDGKLTAFETDKICVVLTGIVKDVKNGFGGWLEPEDLTKLTWVQTFAVLYVAAFWVTLIMGLHALVCHFMRKSYSGRWFAISQGVLFVFCCVVAILAGEADLQLRPTLWAVLAPAAAVASCVLWTKAPVVATVRRSISKEDFGAVLDAGKKKLEKLGELAHIAEKSCPNCGAQLKRGELFCPSCGARRPEDPVCAGCGASLPEGALFCVKCGAPVSKQRLCPGCGSPVPPDNVFCENCGCRLE